MATNTEMTKLATDSAESTASTRKLVEALDAMMPDADTQMAIDFAEVFPAVKSAKDRGVPTKQIVEGLKKKWPNIHHATFRKLCNAELAARNERGERMYCKTCGQPLHAKEPRHAEESASLADTADINAEVVS